MPRQSRKVSSTKVYHVMVRGNEKKDIFLDDADRVKFLDTLRNKKLESEYRLLAYCLMGNHVHLLVKEEGQTIARVMRRINVSYALYFNQRYSRTGHVFQDRYKSEPVDTEAYLLTVLKYIHHNPVKAGWVTSPANYRWSSYSEYVDPVRRRLVDTGEILTIFSSDQGRAIRAFLEHSNSESNLDPFAEEGRVPGVEDLLPGFFANRNLSMDLIKLKTDLQLRNELVFYLRDAGLSVQTIARSIGLNKNTICRATKLKGGTTAKILEQS